jgi:hypothetical protein
MASAVPKPTAPIDPGLKAVVLAAIRKGEENVKAGGGPFGAAVVKNDGSFEVVSCEVRWRAAGPFLTTRSEVVDLKTQGRPSPH